MKKVFITGLLALAISVSANAKTVSKVSSLTKSKHHIKNSASLFDCSAGMTTCGVPYSTCGDISDQLALWDWAEVKFC